MESIVRCNLQDTCNFTSSTVMWPGSGYSTVTLGGCCRFSSSENRNLVIGTPPHLLKVECRRASLCPRRAPGVGSLSASPSTSGARTPLSQIGLQAREFRRPAPSAASNVSTDQDLGCHITEQTELHVQRSSCSPSVALFIEQALTASSSLRT